MDSKSPSWSNPRTTGLLAALVLLFVVLSVLFHNSYLPGHTLASNDGPLGTLKSQSHRVPDTFSGGWQDLNSIGFRESGASPSITYGLLLVLGPVGFSKFYAPFCLLFLGLGAWCFLRQLRLVPAACILGGLAATLNSGFFSAACWGVAAHPLTIGLDFFALALLVDASSPWRWARVALAGLCVGMGVVEGADIGAIFSLFVAAFVIYQAWVAEGSRRTHLATGVLRVGVVAVFAAFLAAQSISVLVATQIKGVAGAQQDTRSKLERWDWATQWSLPKREALGIIIPGLFGYRMDTPEGGNYWGAAGRDPAWYRYYDAVEGGALQPGVTLQISFPGQAALNTVQPIRGDGKVVIPNLGEVAAAGKTVSELEQELVSTFGPRLSQREVKIGPEPPGGFLRFTGGGNYAGILVVLVALWAALQGFRKVDSVFSPSNQRWIGFWTAVAVISLLLAFGRFAPFYRLLYALPYFSTIRNPAKFTHVFNWALVVLFGYGVNALWKRYLAPVTGTYAGVGDALKTWWAKARGFDRRWTLGCVLALAAAVVGWMTYASKQEAMVNYLQQVGFEGSMGKVIAQFSAGQLAWFILFFAVAIALVMLALSGAFSGPRAKWGAVLFGLFLVADLGRANQPWIITWNYEQKYELNAKNPVLEFLHNQPYEHRVAVLPFRAPPELSAASELYRIEWAQHQFLYYNIQSLDVVQMSRVPEDLEAFERALQPRGSAPTDVALAVTRKWQLTNTRYLIGPAGFLDVLNTQLDPVQRRFRIALRYQVIPKPGIPYFNPYKPDEWTASLDPNGNYAVFEFTGALSRAKLYSSWQVSTNDQTTLERLGSPEFHPESSVLVAESVPAPATSTAANESPGKVEFTSYAPKDIKFRAEAPSATVLLLNDRYDPNWKVSVDGMAAPLLRCNYIMRGVFLPAGQHQVEFRFKPPMDTFYVSLAGVIVGVALSGLLFVVRDRPVLPAAPEPVKAPPQKGRSPQTAGRGK